MSVDTDVSCDGDCLAVCGLLGDARNLGSKTEDVDYNECVRKKL